MTTIRKAATDLQVGDYFWHNRELRRVTDVDALYVFGEIDLVVVTITTFTDTVIARPTLTFDVEVFEEDPCAT